MAGVAFRSNATCSGSTTTNCPHFREYDNTNNNWATDVTLGTAGSAVRGVMLRGSPTEAKAVIVALSSDGTLDSYVCTKGCNIAGNWVENHDFADLWTNEPAGADRPFDMQFEQSSGDLIIIYDKVSAVSGQELFYRVMAAGQTNTAFGSESTIDTQSANAASDYNYPFIRCTPKVGVDNIACIEFDLTNTDANAMLWDGNAWGNNAAVTTSSVNVSEEQIGIAYERNSGDVMAVAAAGAEIASRAFTSSWQTAANIGGVAIGVGNVNWISMKPTPRSAGNEIYLAFSGDLDDFATIQWSGTAWGTGTEHDAAIDSNAARVFDIAMSLDADGDGATVDALLMWGTATNSISYRSWSATNTYGTASTISNTGTHPWVQFARIPNPTSADNIDNLGATLDSAFDISRLEWTGGANAPTDLDDDVTTDTTVTTFEAYSVEIFQTQIPYLGSQTLSQTTSNSVDRVQSLFTTISQSITTANTIAANVVRTISQTFALTTDAVISDYVVRAVSQALTITTNASLSEFVTRIVSQALSVTTDPSLSDYVVRAVTQALSITTDGTISNYLVRAVSQALTITTDPALSTYITLMADQVLTITTDASLSKFVTLMASQTLSLTTDPSISDYVVRAVGQTLSITTDGTISNYLVRVISQSLTITTDPALSTYITLMADQALSITTDPALTEFVTRIVEQALSVTIDSSVTTMMTRIVDLSLAVAADSTVASVVLLMVDISQSITTEDVLERAGIFAIEISEVITTENLVDRMQSLSIAIEQSASLGESIIADLIPGSAPPSSGNVSPPPPPFQWPSIPIPTFPSLPATPTISAYNVVGPTFALVYNEAQRQEITLTISHAQRVVIDRIEVQPGYEWIKPKMTVPYEETSATAQEHIIKIPLDVIVPANLKERTAINVVIHGESFASPGTSFTATAVVYVGDPYNNNDVYWIGGVLMLVVIGALFIKKRGRR